MTTHLLRILWRGMEIIALTLINVLGGRKPEEYRNKHKTTVVYSDSIVTEAGRSE